MSWEWAKANRMDVAKFATDDALKLFDLDVSSFDLRRKDKIEDLLKAIYDTLVLQNIQYEREKTSFSETHQRIRTPFEVLKTPRQGTCLDLALLFCGLCLGCNLLPKLVMLEGHALVVIPILKDLCRENYKSADHHQKEFRGKWKNNAHGNPRIDPDTYENKDQLINDLINENKYRVIECTGFACSKSMISESTELPPEFKRDEKGYLTFEQAKEVGRKQLDRLSFLYAVDIEIAHKEWGIRPETFNYGGGSDTTASSNNQKILHIILTLQNNDYVSLRYFWGNAANYKEHRLSLAEIKLLSNKTETDYYTHPPVDYTTTGQVLYNWLDQSDCFLANALKEPHFEGLVIAIDTGKGLANLPWELLHDGKQFLVEKSGPIIPVRWVSNGKPIELSSSPQNRPLNVLFMATSPKGVEPELDYEAEERQILEATKCVPPKLNLRVEESGCLNELRDVVCEYETGYFDVFHLTGHTSHNNDSAYFLTEDEYGQRVDSNASKIANALESRFPRLVFLSGCCKGFSSDNAVPSMAEELLKMGGATAVIGWGEGVRDIDATVTAGMFYRELARGIKLTEAIASTYKALINQKIPDWHKLRLYVGSSLPQELVTPSITPERKKLPIPPTTVEFLDDEKRLRVVSRENFVGRRRQLQNCLRTIKTDNEKVGVLIHGMGGLGKSSIAARIWERLAEHEKILWWRNIDESYLINKLKNKLIKPETRVLVSGLEDSQIELKSRLAYLFSHLTEHGEKPFLLILDDFEWNLETRAGEYILKPEVTRILEALILAVQETGTSNRILITCRYDFHSDLLSFFYKQGLDRFSQTVLTKKLNRLKNFDSDKISESLRERALILADGNPRLLEHIDDILGNPNFETKLTELEQNPGLWKEKVIWDELYPLIDEPLQKILSHCLVYEIPVPMAALESVCESLPNYKQQLKRGTDLALIDVSSETREDNRVYRVSRILTHIILSIKLPEGTEVYSLYQKASEKLYQLWGVKENPSQEQWQEIFRLKFANKENSERFREGFYQMLAVQMLAVEYNSVVYQAFESELRKVTSNFVGVELCKLENYLKQQQWKEADKETAWIFYQVMVKENHENFDKLLKNFPCEILREIDRLWLDNSTNKFGISRQSQIYKSWLDNSTKNNINKFDISLEMRTYLNSRGIATYEDWRILCNSLGWISNNSRLLEDVYTQIPQMDSVDSSESPSPILPVLIYHIYVVRGGQLFGWVVCTALNSLLSRQDL